MSREEFVGWQAHYSLEPWGCHADDHRTELQLNLLYAINSKPRSKIPRFIDRDPRPEPRPTPQQLDDKLWNYFVGRARPETVEKPENLSSE